MPRRAARELGGSRCLTVTVCLGNEAGGHNVAIRLTIGLLVEGSLTEASKFLAQLFEQRDLVTDLQPSKMEERRDRLRPDHTVRITCFATASPPRDDIHPPSDAFYKDMYGLAHDWCGSQIAAPVNQAVKVLRAACLLRRRAGDRRTRKRRVGPSTVSCGSSASLPTPGIAS